MADVIRSFDYSRVRGRGKGVLGLTELKGVKNSSLTDDELETKRRTVGASGGSKPVGVALYSYKANPDSPGGFKELGLNQEPKDEKLVEVPLKECKKKCTSNIVDGCGLYLAMATNRETVCSSWVMIRQLVEILREHPDNEHWWEVRTDSEEMGFVPSAYIIIKDQKALPWLQEAALKSEEEERKVRMMRLKQEQSAIDGTGFGPPPRDLTSLPPKPYQSAYGNSASTSKFYCEVCDKKLNGIKPYQAHMVSKAHKEEVALLEEQEQ